MIIYTPWTTEQVKNLNDFQEKSIWHPFTCGNELCRRRYPLGYLEARKDGWYCLYCPYRQNWAHSFMVNGSWRQFCQLY